MILALLTLIAMLLSTCTLTAWHRTVLAAARSSVLDISCDVPAATTTTHIAVRGGTDVNPSTDRAMGTRAATTAEPARADTSPTPPRTTPPPRGASPRQGGPGCPAAL